MPAWICATCAVQYPDTVEPPARCPICEDERQYVGWDGQRWTTAADLARDHASEVREEEPDLLGIGVTPKVGIGQRALLVRTPHGNVLWDAVPLLDDAARDAIAAAAASTPSASPTRTSTPRTSTSPTPSTPACCCRAPTSSGSSAAATGSSSSTTASTWLPGVTLARIGGHFDGAAVLHWAAGSAGAARC
jgi:hypothetical protein